jgi:N-acetylgalactosamine kinase
MVDQQHVTNSNQLILLLNLTKDNKDALTKIYDNNSYENENVRYSKLTEKFELIYNCHPQFIARAPGRVNLIGEHIDYAGFAVLPMAIENDILIAVRIEKQNNTNNNSNLTIKHFNSDKHKDYNFQLDSEHSHLAFVKPHDYANYIIAGYNAIINYIKENNNELNNINISILVTGNVPYASGLSSSSALTVASAIAFVKSFGIDKQITKQNLTNATINYERSVGTACGGMDQTISIFAEKNEASLIEFNPCPKTKPVYLPEDVTFIIANSLTDSPKIDTLAYRYNKRVVENKLGLAIISYKLKLSKPAAILWDLKEELKLSFSETAKIINDHLKDSEYTLEEVEEELGLKDEKVLSELLDDYSIDYLLKLVPYYQEVLNKNSSFKLKDRLLHVCLESERVEKFYHICQEIHQNKNLHNYEEKVKELGKLMNHSHLSCKELYECSSKELDTLVEYSLEHGAYGARLTGAGWGGCCVIMVPNKNLEYLMEKLGSYYFSKSIDKSSLSTYYFKTKASQGACIINV